MTPQPDPALDPPRRCPRCGRRLRVQIYPLGYDARCPACSDPPNGQGHQAADPPEAGDWEPAVTRPRWTGAGE